MNLQTDQLQTHAAFPVQRVEPEAQDAVKNPESGIVLSYTQNKNRRRKWFLFKQLFPWALNLIKEPHHSFGWISKLLWTSFALSISPFWKGFNNS